MTDLLVYGSTIGFICAMAWLLRFIFRATEVWYDEIHHGWDREPRPMATRRVPANNEQRTE